MLLEDEEQVENEVDDKGFDYGSASDEILNDKFGEESQSDKAIEFMSTEEFDGLIKEKQTAAGVPATKTDGASEDNTKEKEAEEVFDLKNLDEEGYDLTHLKAADLKAAINNQAKTVREGYEAKTQETIKELEIAKNKTAETSKENGEFKAAITALPEFMKDQFGIDISKDMDMRKELNNFVISAAAKQAGLSVPDYIAKGQKEEADLAKTNSDFKESVDKAYKDFSEDEDFKALDIEDKETLLKQHLIDSKFDTEKGDIKKEARTLFMDQYDTLIEEKAIAKALENNSKGSNGKANLKGKHKEGGYNPAEDKEFIQSMKDAGFTFEKK